MQQAENIIREQVSPYLKNANDATGISALTPGSVPYAGPSGTLVQDATGLNYTGGVLQVGTSNPSVSSGIGLNGARAALLADQNGLLIRVGVTSGGAFDTSKKLRVFNGTNTPALMDFHTTGTGPYLHHFNFSLIVPLNYANDAAAATAGLDVGDLYHTNGAFKIRIA